MLVPVFSLCLLVGAVTRAGARPPHVLLLMPDQWRYDWDGLHTDDGAIIDLRLPNLRALQTRGTRFTQAYVPSPVCAPSRSCMASLREYDFAGTATNGANDYDVSIPTYFSALQAAGYHDGDGQGRPDRKTQLRYSESHDTRNRATYHQRELGFSDAIRFCGKQDVVQTYPRREPCGYMLNATSVALENGTRVNAFAAPCIAGKRPRCATRARTRPSCTRDAGRRRTAALLARAGRRAVVPVGHFPGRAVRDDRGDGGRRRRPRVAARDRLGANTTCAGAVRRPGLGNARSLRGRARELDRLFGVVLDAAARRVARPGNLLVCAFSDHGELLDDHDGEGKSKPWQGAVGVPLVAPGRASSRTRRSTRRPRRSTSARPCSTSPARRRRRDDRRLVPAGCSSADVAGAAPSCAAGCGRLRRRARTASRSASSSRRARSPTARSACSSTCAARARAREARAR